MLALLVTVAVSTAAPADSPWKAADLNALAAKTLGWKPSDQFDTAPVQPSVSGAHFDIEVPVRTIDTACFGYPYWDYSTQKKTLFVNPGGEQVSIGPYFSESGPIRKSAGSDPTGELVRLYASSCKRSDLQSYTATNAYGASFKIDPTLQTVTAIADDPGVGGGWPEYFELTMEGSEARALVDHLKLRTTGTLRDWRPGVAVACGSRRNGPTASSPYDRRFERCLFNGRIDRLELIDDRTGKIIASANRNF